MMWSDKGGGSNFEPAPLGTHLAFCIAVLDLGTQPNEIYKPFRKVMITWELPDELNSEGKPFTVSAFYRMSLNEKANLRHMLINWRGRDFTPQELEGFDPHNLLGKPCQVSITEKLTQKGETRHVVSGVTAVPKRMASNLPPQVNTSVFFSLDDYSPQVFAGLSDKMREMIQKAPEWQALNVSAPAQQVQSQPRSTQRQAPQPVQGFATPAQSMPPEVDWVPDPIDEEPPF